MDNDQPPDHTNKAANDDTDDPHSEAEPAHILHGGIGYVRGWAQAARAATALKKELSACGLDDALPYLHAEVNVFGVGMVELGRITPETAHALAALLARAHTNTTTTTTATATTTTTTTTEEDTHRGNAA